VAGKVVKQQGQFDYLSVEEMEAMVSEHLGLA